MDQVGRDVDANMLKPMIQGFLLQASVSPSLGDVDHVLVHQNFYDSFGDLFDLEPEKNNLQGETVQSSNLDTEQREQGGLSNSSNTNHVRQGNQ